MRLQDGESVQEHIRKLTELFEELAVIGDPMKEEDQVVHLLASLPEFFSVCSCYCSRIQCWCAENGGCHRASANEERKQQDKGSSSPSKLKMKSQGCTKVASRERFKHPLDNSPVGEMYSSSNKYYKLVLQKTGLWIRVLPAICATTRSCCVNSNCLRNQQK